MCVCISSLWVDHWGKNSTGRRDGMRSRVGENSERSADCATWARADHRESRTRSLPLYIYTQTYIYIYIYIYTQAGCGVQGVRCRV